MVPDPFQTRTGPAPFPTPGCFLCGFLLGSSTFSSCSHQTFISRPSSVRTSSLSLLWAPAGRGPLPLVSERSALTNTAWSRGGSLSHLTPRAMCGPWRCKGISHRTEYCHLEEAPKSPEQKAKMKVCRPSSSGRLQRGQGKGRAFFQWLLPV